MIINHTGAVISSDINCPPPPSEDRYAALKDLDCLMKSQLLSAAAASETNAVDNSNNSDWSKSKWN